MTALRRLRRAAAGLAAGFLVLLATAAPAAAQETPEQETPEVAHSETVPLDGTALTVSFTDWPVVAGRSLDFLFEPEGGIRGRTGTLRAVSPSGQPFILGVVGQLQDGPELKLPRYPLDRDVWGVDVASLPEEGTWRLEFTVTGPEGAASGSLPLQVGPRPGPPALLSWVVGLLPWIAAVPLLALGWTRTRQLRIRTTRTWEGRTP